MRLFLFLFLASGMLFSQEFSFSCSVTDIAVGRFASHNVSSTISFTPISSIYRTSSSGQGSLNDHQAIESIFSFGYPDDAIVLYLWEGENVAIYQLIGRYIYEEGTTPPQGTQVVYSPGDCERTLNGLGLAFLDFDYLWWEEDVKGDQRVDFSLADYSDLNRAIDILLEDGATVTAEEPYIFYTITEKCD